MNLHKEEHLVVEQSLTEALFRLMRKKAFSEITVTELVKCAGVARSTYYRNYYSKEDIIKKFISNVFENFCKEYPAKSIKDRLSNVYFERVAKYVFRYRDRLSLIHKAGLSSLYLESLNSYFLETLDSDASADEGDKIYIYALAGAQFNLIFNYLLENQGAESLDRSSKYL